MALKSFLRADTEEQMDVDDDTLGRKASHVTKACNACKRRKAKCDRQRPSCGPCQLRREKCEFTEGDRRHHPDRQFVDTLEQRNKSLEDRTRELNGQVDFLVKYIERMGLDVPTIPEGSESSGGYPSQSPSATPEILKVSICPKKVNGKLAQISPKDLPISPRASPLVDEQSQLQDPTPKMIRDERGNHTLYGATSAFLHLEASPSASHANLQSSYSTPGSHPRSTTPLSPHSSHSSPPPPGRSLDYEHTRHLPYHLPLSLPEHEVLLLCLFRNLPAHQKHHSRSFLHSMRRTLQHVAPPTPYSLPPPPDPSLPFLPYSLTFDPPDDFTLSPSFDCSTIMFPEPLPLPLLTTSVMPQITPHYSPTLHNATLALALAYSAIPELSDQEQRREVAQMAKANLETELALPSLTGVRALGFLAVFHAGMADYALGWQYFGMSVRMAQALGLNLDCTSLVESGDISESLQRERNITFWSVFIQDKFWSLWFGRTVALHEGSYDVPVPEPNEDLDNLPLNAGDGADGTTIIGCQPAFLSSTFVQTCKLMIIATRILNAVYGTQKAPDMDVVCRLRLELDDWHNKLPPALHYSTTTLSASIPHILTLQMTFNWLVILLDRPFYRSITEPLHLEPAVKRCDAALRRLVRLFRSWHDSHGLRYCTIEHSFIVFTAGATFLLSAVQFKPLSEKKRKEGVDGVRWCIRVLKEMGTVWPSAKEKASILFKLQKKFFTSVDGADGMTIEPQRGEAIVFPSTDLGPDADSWSDLHIGLSDENFIPQFVIDPANLQHSYSSGDSGLTYQAPLSPQSLLADTELHDPYSARAPSLGADEFLTNLYLFMDNYDTAPQQPQYQAPSLGSVVTEPHADEEDAPGSPLLAGWAIDLDAFEESSASPVELSLKTEA